MKKNGLWLGLIGCFFILGLVFLWPLPRHFNSAIPFGFEPRGLQSMRPGDQLESFYFFWNFKDAVLSGRNPFFAHYHFAAGGPPEVVGLTRWPFTLVFIVFSLVSDIFAYNAILVLSFILSGLAAYALAYYYTKDRPAALVAGTIYCLNPFSFSQLLSGHINGPLSFTFPLFLLCLELSLVKGKKWAGWAAAAILISVAFSAEVHILLFMYLALAFFVLWKIVPAWLRQKKYPWAGQPAILVLAGLALSLGYTLMMKRLIVSSSTLAGGRTLREVLIYSAPLFFPILRGAAGRFLYFGVVAAGFLCLLPRPAGRSTAQQSRFYFLLSLVILSALVLLAPQLTGLLQTHYRLAGLINWLMIPAGCLLLWPIFRNRARVFSFYAFLVWFSYFFCLGAYLPVYPWLHRYLPLLNYFRDPTRAGIMLYTALAVLAALGWQKVFPGKNKGWLILVLFLVIFDFKWASSIGLCRLDRQNPVYAYIKSSHQPGDKVLELPLLTGTLHQNSVYEYYITLSRTPIINGYHPYPPRGYNEVYEKLRDINRAGQISDEQWRLIKNLGIKYLVLHQGLFDQVPQKYLLFPPPDSDHLDEPWGLARPLAGLAGQKKLKLVKEADGIYLFETGLD